MKNKNAFVRIGLGLITLYCLQSCQNEKRVSIPGSFPNSEWTVDTVYHSGSELSISPKGIQVTGKDNNPPMATCSISEYKSEGKWLILKMKSDLGPYGGFWFSKKGNVKDPSMTKYSFPIRSDNEIHTYNVWLGDYYLTPRLIKNQAEELSMAGFPGSPYKNVLKKTEFNGEITSISVIPTYAPNGKAVIESVSISDKPVGPPLLIAEYCGGAESVYRAGKPGVYGIRVRNAGGTPATGIKIRFLSNGELQVDRASVRCLPDTILPDESRSIYFYATGKRIIDLPVAFFKVTVECNEGDDVEANTNPVKIYPSYSGKTGEIPLPNPIRTDYRIGAWYFPGWCDLTHWTSIVKTFERRPDPGFYDETSPLAADWNIKWAVDHGVNYFKVLVFSNKGKVRDQFIKSLIQSRFIKYMQFHLCWENRSSGAMTKDEFIEFISYLSKNYFKHPSYQRSEDGRVVMSFINTDVFVSKMANNDPGLAKEFLDIADSTVKSYGIPGICWDGGRVTKSNARKYVSMGIEITSYYNWIGTEVFPASPVENYFKIGENRIWNQIPFESMECRLPLVTGFDHRNWKGGRNPSWVYYGLNKQVFTDHLRKAKAELDSIGKKDLLIGCWNEWGEGSCLAPYALTGFSFLESVREVFAPGEAPRTIVTPKDVGIYVPEIPALWDWVSYPHLDPAGKIIELEYGVDIPANSYSGQK